MEAAGIEEQETHCSKNPAWRGQISSVYYMIQTEFLISHVSWF